MGTGTHKKALCKCDCGNEKVFFVSNIRPRNGKTRYTVSCGCMQNKIRSIKLTKHGISKTKFYKRWRSMFDRINPNYIDSHLYTGIKICNKWKKFQNFMKDMYESYNEHVKLHGERKTTLDRINSYGNYEPSNCRWATPKVQAINQRRYYKLLKR